MKKSTRPPNAARRRISVPHPSGLRRPTTRDELGTFVREHLDLRLPDQGMIEGHSSALDYLAHTFFEGRPPDPRSDSAAHSARSRARAGRDFPLPVIDPAPVVDCIVWANRGGGKTLLGAVATLLDMVFKDGIQIRILGGSLEQSQRMHEHLRHFLGLEPFADLVQGRMTDRRIRLTNRSSVELLSQSQTSIRGTRVQKLRCDEVELFDRDVWEAAQLVTRSRQCGDTLVHGAVECLSTMHVPRGIMHGLLLQAAEGKRRLFKWGVADVLEHCEPFRACETCTLLPECQGRAKLRPPHRAGHISISDAIGMKARVGAQTWESEMLCLRPSTSDVVLPEFQPRVHVVDDTPQHPKLTWVGGMDFGMRAPAVVLWACLDPGGTLWVCHERSVAGVVLDEHIEAILDPQRPVLEWLAVDPSGRSRNDQSGLSNIDVMTRRGINVRWQESRIADGIRILRARLRPADGTGPRLFIHSRCANLIESLERYCYSALDPDSEVPEKGKGFDHAVDALRYLVTKLDRPFSSRLGTYA